MDNTSVKIASLELENVKRIKAVRLVPTEKGLTVIGGNNGQGKTSVLDAIAWALGGDRYRPSSPERDGSVVPPRIRIVLNNGLVVERAGKNSALRVTDPTGHRGGQQLLNSFVEELALNLPKFMEASGKEKADTLLKIIGVGDQLYLLENKEKQLYNQRLTIGRIADQKAKYAKEMPFYDGVPETPVSAMELIQRQQEILLRNAENQKKRIRVQELAQELRQTEKTLEDQTDRLRRLLEEQTQTQYKLDRLRENLQEARKTAQELLDESTVQLEADLQNIDAINIKVRANLDREKAEAPSGGGLRVSKDNGMVYKNGHPLELSAREFDILCFLSAAPGRVFSREELMEQVWGYDYYGDLRAVDVAIRRLREKIEDEPASPRYIITKRGMGYYFADGE